MKGAANQLMVAVALFYWRITLRDKEADK